MPHHWCAHTHQSSRCNWKTIQADRRCEKEKQTKQQKRSRTMSHHLCTHTHQSSHCTWTSIQARRRCKAHYIMLSPAPLSLYIFSNLTWWQGLTLKTLETKTLSEERERERERERISQLLQLAQAHVEAEGAWAYTSIGSLKAEKTSTKHTENPQPRYTLSLRFVH
jgi:hypothetical protein